MAERNQFEGAFISEVYCVTFGCGTKLSFRERIFGTKCCRCSMEGQIISLGKISNMDKSKVALKVIQLLSDNYHTPDEILQEHKLYEDIGLDSIDVVEFTILCENEFKTTIPDEKIGEIKTVGDVIEAIAKCRC